MTLLTLPRIYPITDRTISGLSHLEQVRQLVDGGATFIQLREKHLPPRAFYEQAREAVEYAHQYGVRIIINDRADIAIAADADGVHLGQTDMPPAAAREVLGPHAIIGDSTHSIDEAAEAALLPIDYVAIGPVFATGTKENPDPVVGLSGVAAVRSRVPAAPLVAIGGIDASNMAAVIEAGADSSAIISGILQGHITDNLARLIEASRIDLA